MTYFVNIFLNLWIVNLFFPVYIEKEQTKHKGEQSVCVTMPLKSNELWKVILSAPVSLNK